MIPVIHNMAPVFIKAVLYPIRKWTLDPLRLMHFLALAYLVARLLPADAAWLGRQPARAAARAAQRLLPVFTAGLVLSLIGMGVRERWGAGAQSARPALRGLCAEPGATMEPPAERSQLPKISSTGEILRKRRNQPLFEPRSTKSHKLPEPLGVRPWYSSRQAWRDSCPQSGPRVFVGAASGSHEYQRRSRSALGSRLPAPLTIAPFPQHPPARCIEMRGPALCV